MKNYIKKINFVIFPFILIFSFSVSIAESYKYIGFFQKHFYISSYLIYLLSFINFVILIMSKKLLEKVKKRHLFQILTGIGAIMFFIVIFIYIILNELEILYYPNFSYLTFHIQPVNFIFSAILLFEAAILFFKTRFK